MAGLTSLLTFKFDTSGVTRAIDSIKGAVGKIPDALHFKATVDTDTARKAIAGLKDTAKESFGKLGASIKDGLGEVTKLAAGGLIAGGLVGGLEQVVEIGSKYQASVAELGAITGVQGQALDDLGGKARNLATQFGGDAVDQIGSFKTILSRLGPDIAKTPEALKKMTENVNILSQATGDSAAASVDALTTAMLQFGVDLSDPTTAAQKMTDMMNTMAAGAQVGAAEVPQVADALKQVGVAAKGAKLSFEETNGALQVLAAGGKVGSEAGVALRNVLGLLQKQSSEGEKTLKAMGLSTAQLGEILTTKGVGAALNSLSGGMGKLGTAAQKNAALMQLFGTENAAAAGILLDHTQQLADFTKGVTGTNTAVDQANQRNQTFEAVLSRTLAQVKDFAITLFNAVAPALTLIVGGVGALIDGIGSLGSFISNNAVGVGILAAALGGLAIAMNASAIGASLSAGADAVLGTAKLALTAITGGLTVAQEALNAAWLANPIGIIIAAVAVLVGGLILLYKNSQTVRDAIDGVWSVLKATGAFIGTFVSTYVSSLVEAFGGLGKVLKGIFTGDFGAIKEGASQVANAVQNATVGALSKATAAFKGSMAESAAAAKKTGEQGKKTGDDTAKGFDKATTAIQQTTQAAKSLGEQFDEATKAAKDAAEKSISTITALQQQRRAASTADERKLLDDQIKAEKANAAATATLYKKNTADRKKIEDQYFGEKHIKETDILGLIKSQAEHTDKIAHNAALSAALADHRKINAKEELDLALKSQAALNDAIAGEQKRVDLINGSTAAGAERKAKLLQEIEDLKLAAADKVLTAQLTVEADEKSVQEAIKKLKDDLSSKLNEKLNKEIEIGLRPKEDGIAAVQASIDRLKAEAADVQIKVKRDATGNPILTDQETRDALARAQEIENQILTLTTDRTNSQRALDDELTKLKLANITDVETRELASLKAQQEEELALITAREASGIPLTEREQEIKKQLEIKHQKELADLKLKSLQNYFDLERQLTEGFVGGLLDIYRSFFDKKAKMSQEDIDDKRLSYDKDRTNLEASLQRGEIDVREYNVKLAKLAKDRSDFEAEASESSQSRITAALADTLGKASDFFAQQTEAFVQAELTKVLQKQLSEEAITQIMNAANVSREVASAAYQAQENASTQVTLIGAMAKLISQWTGVAPIVGVGLGIAAALALQAAFSGLAKGVRSLGFATGGLGFSLVGENGPEIISPLKDFSHMIVTVAKQVAQSTKEALVQGGSGGGLGEQNLNVRGTIVERGRDTVYRLTREAQASANERLSPAF